MIDHRVLLGGQVPDMATAINNGMTEGNGLAQMIIGSQVNRMRDIDGANERKAFAKNNFFGRHLRAQLKQDEAAQAQALREQQKHDADIYSVKGRGAKDFADAGKTTQETGVNRLGATLPVWEMLASTGSADNARKVLNHYYAGNAFDEAVFNSINSELDGYANMQPDQLKSIGMQYAKGMIDPKFRYQSADNAADNITSRANTKDTLEAQKGIADANRASNDAYRMQQLHMQQNKGQIVNAADGKSYIYYPNLNKYEPMLDQSGQHVSKVGTVDKRKESERLQKMESILQQAEGLIGKSTSSGLGNMIDEGASFFGKSNEGADSLAALKSLQGSLVMMMPRMEGPQSDKDVQLYREMAGRLGEPIPASQRMEAIKVIRDLNAKYAEIQGVDSGVAPKGVPYASAGQATTSYNGANVSLSEVKQAAKQAGISTEQMVSILKGQGVSIK